MSREEKFYIELINLIADYENKVKLTDETMKKLHRQKTTLSNALQVLYSAREKMKTQL